MSESQDPNQFLTPEESAEVDKALLTARERFSTRVAIYCLRSLKQISQAQSVPIATITDQQIADWIEQDESIQQPAQGLEASDSFKGFFTRLVLSALKPLKQIAAEADAEIETLTPSQVIAWFEKDAKARIERGNGAAFPS
ncbi:hypothetical protein IQ268_20950 [Oculatella sp. LEGE 06141]|nr:hypothetical protein [Oculatella sp. LEGE 06141]